MVYQNWPLYFYQKDIIARNSWGKNGDVFGRASSNHENPMGDLEVPFGGKRLNDTVHMCRIPTHRTHSGVFKLAGRPQKYQRLILSHWKILFEGRLILAMEKTVPQGISRWWPCRFPWSTEHKKTTWDALKIPEVSPWDLADAGVNPITTRSVF